MGITTLFNHDARERHTVEKLIFAALARNGYPQTALLIEDGIQKDDAGYHLAFETWENQDHYLATATKTNKGWQIDLQIDDRARQPLN